MKKTKLLTSLAALVLVLGLGACEESEIEEPDQDTTPEEEVCEHEWGEWEETTPASCTETGLETRTCTLCGEVETRTIDALGHDYQAVVTAPTCTEKGYTTYTCSRCNDTYTSDETAALGHTWGEWTVTTEPTCTETGTKTRTCTLCGEVETRTIDALGHDYQAVVTNPTCTEKGYTTYTCSRCNDTYTSDETDALGHTAAEGYQSNGSYHWQVCATCGNVIPSSVTACSYEGHTYAYGYDGLHTVCDVCGQLSSETICLGSIVANSDGTYNFIANSNSSLTDALTALATIGGTTTDGAQSTITITEDLTLDAGGNAVEFTIAASNVILDGGEGVTLSSGHEITVSGDNVTIRNITIDGSTTPTSLETYAHAIEITGNDVTLENCTIIGGEAATYTSAVLISAATSSYESRKVEVKGCNVTGAFRAIYIYQAGDVDLYVSDSYLESVYSFNKTGSSNGSLTFINSTLMGWTSYAQSGDVTFTGCTLGFNDDTSQCYGYFRGYSDATFDGCLFRSFVSRQAETTNELTNGCSGEEPIGHDNYMFGVGAADVTYTLLDCQFEHVCDDQGCTDYKVEALTEGNAGYLMSTDFALDGTEGGKDYSSCGFKFSTCEYAKVYTYSDYSVLFGANDGN